MLRKRCRAALAGRGRPSAGPRHAPPPQACANASRDAPRNLAPGPQLRPPPPPALPAPPAACVQDHYDIKTICHPILTKLAAIAPGQVRQPSRARHWPGHRHAALGAYPMRRSGSRSPRAPHRAVTHDAHQTSCTAIPPPNPPEPKTPPPAGHLGARPPGGAAAGNAAGQGQGRRRWAGAGL